MNKELVGILKAWGTLGKTQSPKKKKKGHHFFTSMSVAHVDDEDENNEEYTVRVLSNGDMYNGQWEENIPHGYGKYLWIDGCMYEGDWFMGKTMGKGRFSWPSGATYEGDFKSGFMDGYGTYTGSEGDTYFGSWQMNLKHGKGTKSYANGDYYDGEWKKGVQEGQGKYQWSNGNFYVGQWKDGKMNGRGKMMWANGNRYEGSWEEGLPKGSGKFRWGDGSFYVGIWSKDPREQSGTYYPSGGEVGSVDWDPQDVFAVDLNDCQICPGEYVSVLPSNKMLHFPGVEDEGSQKPTRASVDGRPSNGSYCNFEKGVDDTGKLQPDDVEVKKGLQPIRIQPTKKQGETISKGHRNYELMLNLQLGIRHAVGRPAKHTSLDLKPSAFDPREKFWTKFPPEGSKHTPPHQSCDFKWKDYCPLVFRTLRRLFKVDAADYMISICGDDALRELSSPGKSGSFFYLTNDDRYMIKTIKKAEVKVLIKMLPAYYNHVRAFENTLVTKFFGLHCVRLTGAAQKKVRFVVMGNLFCTEYPIHRRFDLKGSSLGRITDKPDTEIDATTTLKDLDLNFIFRLQKVWFQEFCRRDIYVPIPCYITVAFLQVDRDCEFLEQEGIMDYSLLVGLHFRETTPYNAEDHHSELCTPIGNRDTENNEEGPRLSRADMDAFLYDPDRWASIKLGINMPARAEHTIRRNEAQDQLIGEPTGELYSVILFFGIIDILQDYDISKKLEHAYKSFQYDATSISAVDPRQYARRFRDFILKAFEEDVDE